VPRLRLTLLDQSATPVRLNRARLQRILDAAIAESVHADQDCALTVMLVDDAESQELHAEHFDDPTPTDVMTFPDDSEDPASGRVLLGDLAVGVQVAAREGAARGRNTAEELTLYILHGLLHLIGYDDVTPAKQKRMWAAQVRLLASEGIVIEAKPS
jgi:probable rRNA maturation factor